MRHDTLRERLSDLVWLLVYLVVLASFFPLLGAVEQAVT